MANNEWDSDRITPSEGEEFYQDEFGQQSREFYERMPDSDETAAKDDITADDDTAADELTEEDTMPASGTYENAFRETLDDTDQVGDEKLMDEAESDYTDGGMAAGETDNDILGDKIREDDDI